MREEQISQILSDILSINPDVGANNTFIVGLATIDTSKLTILDDDIAMEARQRHGNSLARTFKNNFVEYYRGLMSRTNTRSLYAHDVVTYGPSLYHINKLVGSAIDDADSLEGIIFHLEPEPCARTYVSTIRNRQVRDALAINVDLRHVYVWVLKWQPNNIHTVKYTSFNLYDYIQVALNSA